MARLQQLSLLILVVLLVTVAVDSDAGTTTEKPPKHSKCHKPITVDCHTSPYKYDDYKVVGWYYFTLFKSCHPLYSLHGVHHCDGNRDLPGNREQCEDLCGEPCRMDNGTIGICAFEEYCRKPPHSSTVNRTPCKAYGVNCCHIKPKPVNKLLHYSTEAPSFDMDAVNEVDYDSSDNMNKTNGLNVHAGVKPKPLGPLLSKLFQ